MAFISVAEELTKKSATQVENKFISRYLAEVDPVSVKVYLYSLYIAQNALNAYTIADLATKLNLTEDEVKQSFSYLEELELVAITSYSPFEIKILDCENYYGKPKKLHPEKYEGLYEELQSILSGRMISQDEFREYLILLEDYGFERNALVMIVSYCVNLKGADISGAYIKKVAKNFAADGITSAKQVEDKLSTYTVSTAALIRIFNACSVKRRPEVEDGALYEKWSNLGFSEDAVICAAKCFKIKKFEKLNPVMEELYKNRKFDVKEIADYRKSKASVYDCATAIAKELGVYVSDLSPYVDNYVNRWISYGFSTDALVKIANYCFLNGRNSFDLANDFIKNLYNGAFVDDESVFTLLEKLAEDDDFIKKILSACGLTRKVISYDRQALSRWRDWGFPDDMILNAAQRSAGKNNPMAYVNYLLSSWKNVGALTEDKIPTATASRQPKRSVTSEWLATIEKLNGDKNN